LFRRSIKKYGHPAGYGYKIALKLAKRHNKSLKELSVDTVAFATQIKGEEIMKAIDAKKKYPYVVKDEKNKLESEQTIFYVHFVDPVTAADLGDSVYSVQGVGQTRRERLLTGSQELSILKHCLVDWENMVDEDGKKVEFDSKNKVEMIARIPPKYRGEIADFIRSGSELTEGEEVS
jgi:hypothetical protein